MRAPIRLCLATLVLILGGCPADPAGDGGGSESEGDSEMGTTMAMTTAAMTMTTADDTTGDDDDDDDDDATTTGTTGDDDDDDDATTSGTTTGGGGMEYPPCDLKADPQCPEPYDECYPFIPGFTVCTAPCESADECPTPGSGDATVVCAGQQQDQCLLDCENGETCPDGMSCESIGAGGMQFFRCVWAAE